MHDLVLVLRYAQSMTKEQIAAVLERVKTWPEDLQERAAELLLEFEQHGDKLWPLTGEERADLEEALREMERGEVANTEEEAEVFRLRRR